MANQEPKAVPTASSTLVESVPTKTSLPVMPSKAIKSKFMKLPNGTRLQPYLIAQCSPTDKGVSILNSSGDMIGFIDARDDEEKQKIMDIIDTCANEGKKFIQPDWNFLN